MGDKPISFKDKDGHFVSAADVWNPQKLEELFTRLNPNRKFRLERERLAKEQAKNNGKTVQQKNTWVQRAGRPQLFISLVCVIDC